MAPSIWQVLIVLAIVVAIFASRYRTWLGRQLHRELDDLRHHRCAGYRSKLVGCDSVGRSWGAYVYRLISPADADDAGVDMTFREAVCCA
jgi:hypothetical protein